MKAVLTTDEHSLTVGEAPAPRPGPREMLLRVTRAGICGSDLHALEMIRRGGIVLGHEFTGVVEALGEGVTRFAVGDRVCSVPAVGCGACIHCLEGEPIFCAQRSVIGGTYGGAFAEFLLVGESWSVRVPDNVSDDLAGLAEPLAVGLRVVERSGVGAGASVLVLGAGPVGLAVTLWARFFGAGQIIVSDPVGSRRDLALRLGAHVAVDPTTEDLGDACVEHLGEAPGIVIECAGRPGMLELACQLAGNKGTVVLAGLHGQPETFHRLTPLLKELSVVFPNFTSRRGFEVVLDMLSQGRIDPSAMISHRIGLADLPATIKAMRQPNDMGKVLVLPHA